MNVILFIFLFGSSSSGLSNSKPGMEDLLNVISSDGDNHEEHYMTNNAGKHGDKSMNDIPANEKTGNYYKDIKQYVFTTQNPNGTTSEISVRARTDVNIALRNYRISSTLANKNFEEEDEGFRAKKQRTTPNVPAFWTMLAKAINGTTVSMDDKDQLFQPVPGSDMNDSSAGDKLANLEELKLRLMLGIALMTILIFIPLVIFCIITLHRLKQLSRKRDQSQYSINPELAVLSYFEPSQGVSDTSFSKSAASSMYLVSTPSLVRKKSIKIAKPEPAVTEQLDEAELLIGEGARDANIERASAAISEEANDAINEANDIK
ncbi:PREDICTED: equatorin [Chinchilla lanigera]|uniref:Equatorin n=1 Tax=Chinchilla lanigera TaxID=34839 RepID=A0A8C2UT11_CHILA|nr:PREDICTED: equatorin [Chinchilla lanigera]